MCQRAHKKKCLFTGIFFRLGCSLHIYSFFAYDLSRQIIKPFWTHFKTDFVCSNLTVLPIGKLVTFKLAIQFKVTFFVVCLYNCRFSFHQLAIFSLDVERLVFLYSFRGKYLYENGVWNNSMYCGICNCLLVTMYKGGSIWNHFSVFCLNVNTYNVWWNFHFGVQFLIMLRRLRNKKHGFRLSRL